MAKPIISGCRTLGSGKTAEKKPYRSKKRKYMVIE
jgi:hypothetical protein